MCTGEGKGEERWEPGSFCGCKMVVCAPTCGAKICRVCKNSLHHADGLHEFMPELEHWEHMLAFGSQNATDGRDVVIILNQGPET